jgi:hypothetical protein
MNFYFRLYRLIYREQVGVSRGFPPDVGFLLNPTSVWLLVDLPTFARAQAGVSSFPIFVFRNFRPVLSAEVLLGMVIRSRGRTGPLNLYLPVSSRW